MTGLPLGTNLLIEQPDFALLKEDLSRFEVCTPTLCYAELIEGELSADPAEAAAAVMQPAATTTSRIGKCEAGESCKSVTISTTLPTRTR